jgi:hypothetical protein
MGRAWLLARAGFLSGVQPGVQNQVWVQGAELQLERQRGCCPPRLAAVTCGAAQAHPPCSMGLLCFGVGLRICTMHACISAASVQVCQARLHAAASTAGSRWPLQVTLPAVEPVVPVA